MKQFLRSFLTLIMLVVWASGSFAVTTIDFSSGLPNGWTKSSGTVKGMSYQGKNCTQLQKNTEIQSPVFTKTVIKKIELSLSKSDNSTFDISYQIDNKTPIVIAKNVGSSMSKQKWYTLSFDFPKEAQVEGGKIIIDNSKSSFFIEKITLTEIDNSKKPSNLSFPNATESVDINGTFNAPVATLTSEGVTISGKNIKYTSNNTAVATVNESTGEVTIVGRGHTKITASLTGDAEYNDAEASYILTVIDPYFTDVTFNFQDHDRYGYGVSSNSSTKGDMDEGKSINEGIVTLTNIAKGTGTGTRFWSDGIRVYTGAIHTISVPEGYVITSLEIEYGSSKNCVIDNQSNPTNWTGSKQSIDINYKDKTFITSIKVTYKINFTLDESKDNTETISNNNGKTIDIKLTRTLVANKWNTFCVPFETEIDGTALAGATVKAVGTVVGNVINLVDADKIEAGVPYLVMPTTESIVNPTFKSVTITEISAKEAGNTDYKFVGTYSPKTITVDEFGKIWGVTAEGKLAKINEGTTMKGLRAYFVFPVNVAAKLNFDGETTGINNIETEATVNGKVYNLNGQYVGNSLNGLKKGIYVVNGKKVIK